MRSHSNNNLARIEAAETRARAYTARKLKQLAAAAASPQSDAPRNKIDTSKWSPRARARYHRAIRQRIAERQADDYLAREREADRPMQPSEVDSKPMSSWLSVLEHAVRWQREVAVRRSISNKLFDLARTLPEQDERLETLAERLYFARTKGHWGVDLKTGKPAAAWEIHSHYPLLDPAESRERQREVIARLVPVLQGLIQKRYRLYSCVLTTPNVPAGSLAWGKAQIFQRFDRVVRGVRPDGKAKLAPAERALPEVVGAFVTQEDPLGQDLETWNIHLNVLLVVDRKLCVKLPGDPVAPGALSFKKLRAHWGYNLEVRELTGTPRDLIRACLEVVKYSLKTITKPQLAHALAAPVEPPYGPSGRGELAALQLVPGSASGLGRPRGSAEPHKRGAAPGFVSWPLPRVHEWLSAARAFRRLRSYGCLYRLPPEPELPERDIRWYGHVEVGATYAKVGPPRPLDSIQPDKSEARMWRLLLEKSKTRRVRW